MKKLIIGVICLLLSASSMPGLGHSRAEAAAAPGIQILLDGYPLPFPVEPVIVGGYTMVPFRAISEALGVQVVWDGTKRTISAVKSSEDGKRAVVLRLNNKAAQVDGTAVQLTVAPRSVNGHTLIPLSFFSRAFGAVVSWEAAAHTVVIVSPKESMYTLGFYALSSFSERAFIPNFNAVAFGWSRLDAQGQFTLSGKEYKWPEAAGDVTPESLVENAKQQGTNPYLMVYAGDVGLEITGVLADQQKQQTVIAQMVQTAADKGFQGILLDLEGLGLTGDKDQVKASFNAFVKAASAAARQAGLKLAIAVPPLNGAYQGYDYKTLGSLADELIIMAYAYGDEKGPEPAAMVDQAIRLALHETGKDKLVLGISLASENETSVTVKVGLAKRYGLKGISIWRLGLNGTAEYESIKRSIAFGE